MKGGIVSLSASADQKEVVVGTTLGNVYVKLLYSYRSTL